MQNAIKLENISNLITSPSSYQCRKITDTVNMKITDTVNMKVGVFCDIWLLKQVKCSQNRKINQ
jgi:hypothetical protein